MYTFDSNKKRRMLNVHLPPNEPFAKPLTEYYQKHNLQHKIIINSSIVLGDIVFVDSSKEITPDQPLRIFGPIIEKKTLADMASSILDNRYHEQSGRAIESGFGPGEFTYLAEGKLSSNKLGQMGKPVLGALVSVNMKLGFNVVLSSDVNESCTYIFLWHNLLEEYDERKINQRFTYLDYAIKVKSKRELQEKHNFGIILTHTYGIEGTRAQLIVDKYKNLGNLMAEFCLNKNKTLLDIGNLRPPNEGAQRIGFEAAKKIAVLLDIDGFLSRVDVVPKKISDNNSNNVTEEQPSSQQEKPAKEKGKRSTGTKQKKKPTTTITFNQVTPVSNNNNQENKRKSFFLDENSNGGYIEDFDNSQTVADMKKKDQKQKEPKKVKRILDIDDDADYN